MIFSGLRLENFAKNLLPLASSSSKINKTGKDPNNKLILLFFRKIYNLGESELKINY